MQANSLTIGIGEVEIWQPLTDLGPRALVIGKAGSTRMPQGRGGIEAVFISLNRHSRNPLVLGSPTNLA
jgi:hypothetical protein